MRKPMMIATLAGASIAAALLVRGPAQPAAAVRPATRPASPYTPATTASKIVRAWRESAQAAPAPTTNQETEAPAVVVDPVQRPDPTPAVTDHQVVLDSAFAREAVDTSWARGAAFRMQETLAPALPPGSQLGPLSCRATLCRAEVRHTTADAAGAFNAALAAGSMDSWEGPGASLREELEGGAVRSVVFLGRAGTTLPAPPDT